MTAKHIGLAMLLAGLAAVAVAFKETNDESPDYYQSGKFIVVLGGLLFGALLIIAGLLVAIFG